MRLSLVLGVLALAVLCVARPHPTSIAAARLKVSPQGAVEMQVRFDILAFVLEQVPSEVDDAAMRGLLYAPTESLQAQMREAAARFARNLKFTGDKGEPKADSISFPAAGDIEKWREAHGEGQLPVMMVVTVRAHLPTGASQLSLRFPDALDTVILTTELPYQEAVSEPVEPGRSSRSFSLPTAAQVNRIAAEVAASTEKRSAAKDARNEPPIPQELKARTPRYRNTVTPSGSNTVAPEHPRGPDPPVSNTAGRQRPNTVTPPGPEAVTPQPLDPPTPQGPDAATPLHAFASYIRLGFVHIVPHGLDHILFVLGLFLLSTRWQDLLKQVTAFTIAHSLTLALAMLGIVRLPATIVEPLIALSIVFVAAENLMTTKMSAWRIYVVFGFGLMHGLGFAGGLQDAGLVKGDFLTALLGFNLGVELGQLSVVAGALLLVGWLRSNERYRPLVAVPASVAIGLTAVVWTVQRLL